jgi:hypothetical protein
MNIETIYHIENINIFNLKNKENISPLNEIESNYYITYDKYYEDLLNLYKISFEILDYATIKERNIDIPETTYISINNITNNITSLKNYIDYNKYDVFKIEENVILKILYDVGFIIKLLEREKKSIFSIDINDIIVLNNDTFLFINHTKIVNINKNYISYCKLLNENQLLKLPQILLNNEEELININTLPINLHYTTVYYSFGIFLLDLLYCYKNISVTNKNGLSALNSMKKYKYSGLYYFIKRCIEEDIENRTLLFI